MIVIPCVMPPIIYMRFICVSTHNNILCKYICQPQSSGTTSVIEPVFYTLLPLSIRLKKEDRVLNRS